MRFEVETPSLNSTVKSMQEELNQITELSKQLYSALTVLDGMWVGAAHDTFAQQYQADQTVLDKMRGTIQAVISGMDSARKTYDQCEASVKTAIQKIAI